MQPPRDSLLLRSSKSKFSGVFTGMVGCKQRGGCQARYLTPQTYSPWIPVERSGRRRPLQVMVCFSGVRFFTFTWRRSTDESTNRVVPPPPGSSPRTYQGSMPWRISISTPS